MLMQFLNEVTIMTSIVEDLIGNPNCITQLSNFLFLFITLDGCSSRNNIPMFLDNNIYIIVNALGVSSATILDKNF